MFLDKKPLFSVVMANYNNRRYIEQAIKSVLDQTYKNWELVIVDDASTDNSVEIIKPYLKNNKIKLIINDKNKGCGYTKRKAADITKGQIVGELDSDDTLTPEAIEVMVKAHLKNPNCGLIYSESADCDENLCFIKKRNSIEEVPEGESMLHKWRCHHFKTFKKKIYLCTEGINPKFRAAEDHDYVYKLEEIAPLNFLPKILYNYRMHKGGISQGLSHIKKCIYFDVLGQYHAYKRRLNTNIPDLTKQEITNKLVWGLKISIQLKKFKQAMHLFTIIMKLNYCSPKILIRCLRKFKYLFDTKN